MTHTKFGKRKHVHVPSQRIKKRAKFTFERSNWEPYHAGHQAFIRQSAMEVAGASKSKKAKLHEAHMIPGVDGHRTFGFPNTILTKLRYCTFANFSGIAGVVQGNTYSANGIFDVDISGVGHQPLYRDNYAALYDQYVVIGSKITVRFLPTAANSLPCIVGITGDDDNTSSTNVETLMEQNNNHHTVTGGYGSHPVELSLSFEPNEDFGVDAKSDGASATAVTANPAEQWYYRVWAVEASGAGVTACTVQVDVEYTVKFTELQTPTQN